jgi:hypothetical protein
MYSPQEREEREKRTQLGLRQMRPGNDVPDHGLMGDAALGKPTVGPPVGYARPMPKFEDGDRVAVRGAPEPCGTVKEVIAAGPHTTTYLIS